MKRRICIRDRQITRAAPWQNAFAERLIGSIRRECVDHCIIMGEVHLCQILRREARYFNELRTHRSLDKDAPISPCLKTNVSLVINLWASRHFYRVKPPLSKHGSRTAMSSRRLI
jgi:transposase InsO family protein